MALETLEVLKKGLKILQNPVKDKKEKLQAQLAKKVLISSQDENWLDHEARAAGFGHSGESFKLREGFGETR